MFVEPPNGSGPVTLGEVYRAVLRVEAGLNEHKRGHETNARWVITTVVAVGAALVALVQAARTIPS